MQIITIFKYRYFVISQLPKLPFLDGMVITKMQERKKAKKLDKKLWGDRLLQKCPAALGNKKTEQPKEDFIVAGDPKRYSRISEYRVRANNVGKHGQCWTVVQE